VKIANARNKSDEAFASSTIHRRMTVLIAIICLTMAASCWSRPLYHAEYNKAADRSNDSHLKSWQRATLQSSSEHAARMKLGGFLPPCRRWSKARKNDSGGEDVDRQCCLCQLCIKCRGRTVGEGRSDSNGTYHPGVRCVCANGHQTFSDIARMLQHSEIGKVCFRRKNADYCE